MTLDPIAPVWLVALLAALLAAFAVWRLVAAPSARLRLWWGLRLLAVLLLVVVALRPVTPAEPAQRSTVSGGLEVYIAVDTTSSMAAEDWSSGAADQPGATRLDGVKADIAAIAGKLRGASFSLVTFDAEAVQRVPLTSDATALVSAGDVLTQEITAYSRGSSIDEPVELLTDILGAAADANPKQQRVLFYLGDGEQTAAVEPGSFDALAPLISGGAVLGYGTDEGGRMREFNGYADPDAQPRYIADYSPGAGGDAVSRIDETRLGAIASQLGVEYLHRDAGSGIDALLDGFDVGDVTVSDGSRGVRTELYWIAAVPLGLLALAELVALVGIVLESRRAAVPARPVSPRPDTGGSR
jgi:Ca-activated chloride channel family protein